MYRYICTEEEDCSEENNFSKGEMLVEGGGNTSGRERNPLQKHSWSSIGEPSIVAGDTPAHAKGSGKCCNCGKVGHEAVICRSSKSMHRMC